MNEYLTFGVSSLLNWPLSTDAILRFDPMHPWCNKGHRNLSEVGW